MKQMELKVYQHHPLSILEHLKLRMGTTKIARAQEVTHTIRGHCPSVGWDGLRTIQHLLLVQQSSLVSKATTCILAHIVSVDFN